MKNMDQGKISILLFLILPITLANLVSYNELSNGCLCPVYGSDTLVPKLIQSPNKALERLVVYLYKDGDGLKIYIPGKHKQKLIPDLDYNEDDHLRPIFGDTVDEVFIQHSQITVHIHEHKTVNYDPSLIEYPRPGVKPHDPGQLWEPRKPISVPVRVPSSHVAWDVPVIPGVKSDSQPYVDVLVPSDTKVLPYVPNAPGIQMKPSVISDSQPYVDPGVVPSDNKVLPYVPNAPGIQMKPSVISDSQPYVDPGVVPSDNKVLPYVPNAPDIQMKPSVISDSQPYVDPGVVPSDNKVLPYVPNAPDIEIKPGIISYSQPYVNPGVVPSYNNILPYVPNAPDIQIKPSVISDSQPYVDPGVVPSYNNILPYVPNAPDIQIKPSVISDSQPYVDPGVVPVKPNIIPGSQLYEVPVPSWVPGGSEIRPYVLWNNPEKPIKSDSEPFVELISEVVPNNKKVQPYVPNKPLKPSFVPDSRPYEQLVPAVVLNDYKNRPYVSWDIPAKPIQSDSQPYIDPLTPNKKPHFEPKGKPTYDIDITEIVNNVNEIEIHNETYKPIGVDSDESVSIEYDTTDPSISIKPNKEINPVTFENWFHQQMNMIKAHGNDFKYDMNNIGAYIMNILKKNGMHVSPKGILTDESGVVLNIHNLKLRPILIGVSMSFDKFLTKMDKSKSSAKYLQSVLVTSNDPPIVLGVIPLGKTYLPLNPLSIFGKRKGLKHMKHKEVTGYPLVVQQPSRPVNLSLNLQVSRKELKDGENKYYTKRGFRDGYMGNLNYHNLPLGHKYSWGSGGTHLPSQFTNYGSKVPYGMAENSFNIQSSPNSINLHPFHSQRGIQLRGQGGIPLRGQGEMSLHHQGGIQLPLHGGVDLRGQEGIDMREQGGLHLHGQSGIDVSGQGGIDIRRERGIDLSGQEGIDILGQRGINMREQGDLHLHGQRGIDLSGQEGIDLRRQGITDLRGKEGIDLRGQRGIGLSGHGGVHLHGQRGIDMREQGGVKLHGQRETDLRGQGGVKIHGQGGLELWRQRGNDLRGQFHSQGVTLLPGNNQGKYTWGNVRQSPFKVQTEIPNQFYWNFIGNLPSFDPSLNLEPKSGISIPYKHAQTLPYHHEGLTNSHPSVTSAISRSHDKDVSETVNESISDEYSSETSEVTEELSASSDENENVSDEGSLSNDVDYGLDKKKIETREPHYDLTAPDLLQEGEGADDGVVYRIIGGNAATSSGTPVSNKGRSGYYS